MSDLIHASPEALAAYWLGDMAEADMREVEEHLFVCEPCCSSSARMAALPRALAFAVPPVVSTADAARLLTLDARIRRTVIAPGGRGVADFSSGVEAQLMALEADLKGVTQVDITLCSRDGTPLFKRQAVPFDAAAGTVTIACRAHYVAQGAFPLEVSVYVEATVDGERRPLGTFDIDHIPPV